MVAGTWTPLYKGVDYATGTNNPAGSTIPRFQAVFVLRLDLRDPDLRLFTDPPCTNCASTN